MKNFFSLIGLLLLAHTAIAQNASLKHDTIFVNNIPYALLEKGKAKPARYSLDALNGTKLIELHDGRVMVKGKPGYVATFLSDQRQCMVTKDGNFPLSFINGIVKCGLVSNGTVINEQIESEFIKAHPLPAGYTDIDQLIEY